MDAGLLVYGATPAGIAAAIAAADDGERVLLVEPTSAIGGMVTSGLSHTDFRTFEALTGIAYDLTKRVLSHYAEAYGRDSQQVRDSFRGTQAEPKVNLKIFEQMVNERRSIQVKRRFRLDSVRMLGQGDDRRIVSATFGTPGAGRSTVTAAVFIDATYEGDLMAAAGVQYRVGREGRGEYNESLAPEIADRQLQAYNFRFCAIRDARNRVPPERPAGYRREDYVGVLPLLADGRIKQIFGYSTDSIYKAQIPQLPNGKFDINDVSHSPVRLSLPGENLQWPDGDEAARRRIFNDHLRWNVGLLWFLQNDDAVPEKFRAETGEWGWCKDEFVDNKHLPPQLYVREARRMVGMHVYAEADTAHEPGDARGRLHLDSIAMGDYSHNCHGTDHEGPRFGGRHTGEFYKPAVPYQVPYGTLVPKDVKNLLVPVAASSSHVGFCALRLEPIWMALGQAAGHAAHAAREAAIPVQRVPVAFVQRRLWEERAATIYVSDVPPGHPDFSAVQWWGTNGGWHGLAPMPAQPGQRGKNILGQYYEAYPNHQAQLERVLDGDLRKRWDELARRRGIEVPQGTRGRAISRGDYVRQAWSMRRG